MLVSPFNHYPFTGFECSECEKLVVITVQSELATIPTKAIITLAYYSLPSVYETRAPHAPVVAGGPHCWSDVHFAAITAVIDLLMMRGVSWFIQRPEK